MSYNSIKLKSDQIRNEQMVGGNTKERVANVVDDLNDTKADKTVMQNFIDDLYKKDKELNEKIDKVSVSGIKGEAFPDTVPTEYNPIQYPDGLFEKYEVHTVGTYTNFKKADGTPIVVTASDLDQKLAYITVTNGVAKLQTIPIAGSTAKKVFDKTDDTNPATMKATADRYDKLLYVNKGFIEMPKPDDGYKDITEASGQYGGYFLQSNNTVTVNTAYPLFGVIKDYDITGFERLEVNNMYYVNGQGSKPVILGIKQDGTIVTLMAYDTPDFSGFHSFDVSQYVKLSIQVVKEYFPNILRLYDGKGVLYTDSKKYVDDRFKVLDYFLNPSGYTDVKSYIDSAVNGRPTVEGIFINLNESSDYTYNVKTTSDLKINVIPRIGNVSNDLFNLRLICGVAPRFVFPESFKFVGGVVPTFEAGYTYVLVMQTFDYGATWFCSVVGAYDNASELLFHESFQKGPVSRFKSFNSNTIESDGSKVSLKGTEVGDSIFYVDTPSPYYTVSGVFGLDNARSKLTYRILDTKNFGLFGYDGVQNKVYIKSVINGVLAENIAIDVAGLNDRNLLYLKVKVNLTSWKFYVNEVLVQTFNNPGGLVNATKAGIALDSSVKDIYIKQFNISSNG